MTTTNLGLATVPTNTTNPAVPVNDAMAAFDSAIAGSVTLALADADVALTQAQTLYRYVIYGGTLTAGRARIYPAAFPTQFVKNNTSQTLTLKKSGQPGITLAAGATALIYSGTTDVKDYAASLGTVSSVNGASGVVVLGGESIAEPVTVLTPAAGVVNINCALGDYFTLAPTANVTSITFSNLPAAGKAQTIMVRFTQDTTARTVAWPASFKWAGGTAGAVSSGSGAVDVLAITTFSQGTNWLATLAKAFA